MGNVPDPRSRPFRRTVRTAAVSTVAVALAFGVGGTTQAQEIESTPETGEINPGTAQATALIATIAPGVGQLELGMSTGVAITKVTNFLAQSTSQAADLGLVGTSLTAEGCSDDPTFTASDLPQPTFVDNRQGDASASRDESQTEGQPLGVGRMDVEASQEPVEAMSRTTLSGLEIGPALSLGAGRATSTTRVLPGEGREAIAEVVSSLNIAGLELGGLRWHAYHRTGVDPLAEAGFEIASGSLGGIPLPLGDIAAAEDAINTALAQTGVTIDFPEIERFTDPADLIRVTPLTIEVRDSPLGATLLGPILDVSRDQRLDLYAQLSEAICEAGSIILVGDVVISVIAGTGFITLEIGGAEALSSDLEILDPFGEVPTPPVTTPTDDGAPPVSTGGGSTGGGSGGFTSGGGSGPIASPVTTPAAGGGSVETAQPVAQSSGPLDDLCESIHPNRKPSCSDGAALAVGVIAVLATAGVAGADLFRQRRTTTGTTA